MLKDSLLFDLLLAVFATIPATGFVGFLAAYCKYYGLPQPLRVNISSISGEPLSGSPRELWESCNPKERLIADSDESCQSFQRKVATRSKARLPVIGAQRRWSFCLTPSL